MKLKSLKLTNFRCFETLNINFEDQLTVVVAENGAGKTAVLDAIAIAIGPFLRGFDTGTDKGFKHEDARLSFRSGLHIPLEDANQRMEAQYPISLDASGFIDDKQIGWSRELTGKKTQTTYGKAKNLVDYAKEKQQKVREGDQSVVLPIAVYYGTGRLWKTSKESRKNSSEFHSRLYGYQNALNSDSTFKLFKNWFTDESLAEYKMIVANILEHKKVDANSKDTAPTLSLALEQVRNAIDQCLSISGWSTLQYDAKWSELVLRYKHDEQLDSFIPVSQLSDGVKAMLALTADIAFRCVKLNPDLDSPIQETEGIVLIDEVDLHLHPKWQQTVLSDLQKTFLKIQFIVTTHSPQVLSTVPSECIRIIDNGEVYSAPKGSKGAESSRLLKRIFNVDTRPQVDENTKLLLAYEKLVYADEWPSSEAKEKRKRLDDIYAGEEPKLTELDLYIENRSWELGLEENQ
ncbi:MAG: AAA family ATPase [Methyloprofundus sp.]|nr:AAA family ATPase [Methyloprofundus sp.]